MFPTQNITIYHKNDDSWDRYVVEASYRNTSYINRNKTGISDADKVLIRVFDVDGYGTTWNCSKEDVIVDHEVTDEIEEAPMTELQTKYGRDNVYQVKSIDIFNFDEELDHVKIGAK
jgi:hypothetical protein